MIERVKENLIMDNGFFRIYNDDVVFNGKTKGHYFRQSLSETLPNYCVIAICEYDGKIILLDNFRYAHQKKQMETVKGMGMKNKTPKETIAIEVEEEIGGIVESIEDLGTMASDISDTQLYCFHVKLSGFKETKHEETESISNIQLYSINEIEDFIKENKIEDMVTLSIFIKYKSQNLSIKK